eukprot:2833085-Rhodomonas_salina.1
MRCWDGGDGWREVCWERVQTGGKEARQSVLLVALDAVVAVDAAVDLAVVACWCVAVAAFHLKSACLFSTARRFQRVSCLHESPGEEEVVAWQEDAI